MRAQRPPELSAAIDAVAEELPFPDRQFDAAMATFTVHQWSSLERGLAEMRRVTAGPVVVLTCDPDLVTRFWLNDYAPQVLSTLRARVEANAKEFAQHGVPRKSFYLTGRVGDEAISLHAEGERVVWTKGDGTREEVDLTAPGRRADGIGVPQMLPDAVATDGTAAWPVPPEVEQPPGTSPLDTALADLADKLGQHGDESTAEDAP